MAKSAAACVYPGSVKSPRVRGVDIMRDPLLNKGLAFTLQERQMLGIHGLLPPALLDQDQQVHHVMENLKRQEDSLERYIYLMSLQDRNEKLFYRVVTQHVEFTMPIIYTPTVGLACQKFGLIFRRPRGLYITMNDLDHVDSILHNWPIDDVKVIVVTDGERILGLGDLGAFGMGIPVGKLALYTALAGIDPRCCLPILIDVGTNNDTLRNDPVYLGLRLSRQRGASYDKLVDQFMRAVVGRFGASCLIQFEDFGNSNAFRLLHKYRNSYCTFNDDIQGTASVAVAGILASLQLTGKKLADNVFVFQGAGEASIGIAKLLRMAMCEEGLSEEQALSNIWLVDSKGLIVKDRPSGGLSEEKLLFAKKHSPIADLGEVVKTLKPTAIIGAAAVPGAFTAQILSDMASFNERPIIFALSNPTSKAECTAEQAYTSTQGRCVFASGSPFPPVTVNGKTLHPGQGNNAYIFPGVGLAVIAVEIRTIPESIFLEAAKCLADQVTKADLEEGRVYPPLAQIRACSLQVATHLAAFAYRHQLALLQPQPSDLQAHICRQQYSTQYVSYLPDLYDWPL